MSKILFIVDPQNDFIEGGSLPVNGGKEALDKLSKYLETNYINYDKILVSLDTHYSDNLCFPENWEAKEKSDKPKNYELLDREKVIRGDIFPVYNIGVSSKINSLLSNKEFTFWPQHCIKGTWGHEIYSELFKILNKLNNVHYLWKGMSDTLESYSAFIYGSGDLTEYGRDFMDIIDDPRCEIDFCGLAEDYCVYSTFKSVLFLSDKLGFEPKCKVLKEFTSSIRSKEETENLYKFLEI